MTADHKTEDFSSKGSAMNRNGSLVQQVLQRNREQSELFCSPDAHLARRLYRAQHPTEILWFKCMDGRLNGSVITKTPVGIIQPVRNIAGTFDLGWPYLGETFLEWVFYAIDHGRRCLPFVTYHWSKSDKHKGCRGHNYDVVAAKCDAQRLLTETEKWFGAKHESVYPILVGIETDEDAMLLHGVNEQEFNLANELDTNAADLDLKLRALYPDMESQVIKDLLVLVEGNIKHIRCLREHPRSDVETQHGEQIIAIGRGFDWLHMLNKALIIGPYSYDLATPIATAANILLDNIKKGHVSKDDGALLMTSGVHRQPHGSRAMAAATKARSLETFAIKVIQERVPELTPYLHVLSGTVDSNTRLFKPLDIIQ